MSNGVIWLTLEWYTVFKGPSMSVTIRPVE